MSLATDAVPTAFESRPPGRELRCIAVNDHELVCVVPAVTALDITLDPVQAESGKNLNATLRELADTREEVQREVAGNKKRNAVAFTEYIDEALRGDRKNWVLPPITAWTPEQLEVGEGFAFIPDGLKLIAIDGETQSIGWRNVLDQMNATQRRAIVKYPVKLVIHHGKSIQWGGQAFHDLNILGVRPSVSIGIGMDQNDPATRITNHLVEALQLPVNRQKRQLPVTEKSDLFTLSTLRTAVLTTIFGMSGVAYGSRGVGDRIGPEQESSLRTRVIMVWRAVIDELRPHLENRRDEVAGAPGMMAAIGAVAHRAIDDEDDASIDDVLDLLRSVDWRKQDDAGEFIWDGILGKVTERETTEGVVRRFSAGGPKEVGYQTYDALSNPHTAAGRRIRRQ